MAKKKNRMILGFMLPFIGAVPIMILGSLEEKITLKYGEDTFTILMVCGVVLVVALSLFPVFSMLKGIFGGKGYNFFWGSGKIAKQILTTGKEATATLKSIGENSGGGVVTINDQPLLNLVFMVDDGHTPYEVSLDTIVSRTVLPQLQPGVVLPVKIDKYDKMLIVFDQSRAGQTNNKTVGGKNWTDADRSLLETAGIDGMAKLQEVDDTGKSEEFNLLLKVTYEVYVPGKEPYIVEKEIPCPPDMVQLMRAAVGKTFKARIHPNDPTKMVVDIRFNE